MALQLAGAEGADIGASESLSHPALLAMALQPRSAVPIANAKSEDFISNLFHATILPVRPTSGYQARIVDRVVRCG
jgi:hypothetical protein